ncbi:MAG TPA: hypothetical protein VKA32_03990, partial [Gammaproteobacteria bacterium]|nr:hypothetical protein [Gammaproteobacteria bacterium]
MNQRTDFDHGTLNWVKRELDDTLQQSAEALQQYSEDVEDLTQLQFCAANLHQVHGILRMLELHGAVMLAEEMEALSQALLDATVAQPEQSAEVLMRGILQLRGYLERLEGGQRDAALLILPLVNDLRAVQNRPLITESALFAPDLSRQPSAPRYERDGEDRTAEKAGEVLPALQRGLLALLRGQRVAAGLQRIAEALDALDAAAPTEEAGAGWWVGAGLAEALNSGQLEEHAAAARGLLGRLERHVRGLIRGDVGPALPESLLRGMLFYIARAEPATPRLVSIHETFSLDELMSEVHGLEHAREGLFGPGTDTLKSVAEAIMEDLAGVKDTLDLFVRGGRDREQLAVSADAMRRMADTLGLLGLASPRRVVAEQAEVIEALAESGDGGRVAAERSAEALLYVESALNDLVDGLEKTDDEDPKQALLEGEYRQVHDATLAESVSELGRIKEAVTRFLESHDSEALEGILERFDAVRGALSMVGHNAAVDVVKGARDAVDEQLVRPDELPAGEALDDLADAISAIEYYLEVIDDDPSGAEEILQRAGASLARLGHPVDVDVVQGMAGVDRVPAEADDTATADEAVTAVPQAAEATGQEQPPLQHDAATDFSRKRGRV